jgi:hypothetical protein
MHFAHFFLQIATHTKTLYLQTFRMRDFGRIKLEPEQEDRFLFNAFYRSSDYCLGNAGDLVCWKYMKISVLARFLYILLLTCYHFIMACKKACVVCMEVPDDIPHLFNFISYQWKLYWIFSLVNSFAGYHLLIWRAPGTPSSKRWLS